MKFTLSWLRYFLDTDADMDAVAKRLNEIGLEVEGIEDPAAKLAGFRVARVLTAEQHPNADKLRLLTVDAGPDINNGQPLQVVCGAPNARAGLVGVLGLSGAVVPANGMTLKVAEVRGVESNGMMCSSRELELGDDHDGIVELPDDAPVGTPFATYRGIDPIIDVSITPNRQDCMGVYGIARDLAAAGLGVLKPRRVPDVTTAFPCPVAIRTDDPAGCPAFYGRVIRGITNGASPEWMQQRLIAAGQRPINAVVDITNYVMLAFGRPSHAYDLSTLSGAVVARRARDGETITALNGKDYTLTADMTVIADDKGVHDIAGIMGGAHSGCSETTRDVLLEVAYFTPEHIARTGQQLALTSDARTRFERGVDPAFLDEGMAIISDLILRICGGAASEIVRAGTPPVDTRTIAFDPAHTAGLGGVDVAPDRQAEILTALGFGVARDGTPWSVTVPSWRRDVEGSADLVEEVVRIIGLDHVASTPLTRPDGVAKATATPTQKLERRTRRAAAAAGLYEAITWSFLAPEEAARFAPMHAQWVLANPISDTMKVMRPSLLPGLLAAAGRNVARGATQVPLFELGRRYGRAADGTSDERLTLGFVLTGERVARHWHSGKATGYGPHDAIALVRHVLAAAGAPVEKLMVMSIDADADRAIWHPGQSASLRLGPKTVLAECGALHPDLAAAYDLGDTVAGQIFLDAIPAARATGPLRDAYAPPVLQAVRRDFAFLVPDTLAAGDLVRAVRGADKENIVDARVFDRFAGPGVGEGLVSLAIEVTLQPRDKSYDEAALKAISDRVIAAATKLGAQLRA